MRILVLGTGYVGTVTAAAFAFYRQDVVACDIDQAKIDTLSSGKAHFYEPQLNDLLGEQIASGRLVFRMLSDDEIRSADVIVCAVGTPPRADGSANTDAVLELARRVANVVEREMVFIIKSTVPPGTCALVHRLYPKLLAASNPEFLAEGSAVRDALLPSRIVYGADDPRAQRLLAAMYKPWSDRGTPVVSMSTVSSEMAKYAANAFLATKISFINEIAELCEALGADASEVAEGIGYDPRIGPAFLKHGLGYGGSCFPKDTQALLAVGKSRDVHLAIVEAAEARNFRQRERYFQKIADACGGSVAGKKIAVLGLAYKTDTDDTRQSPALAIIEMLLAADARISAFDPLVQALPHYEQVQVARTIEEAVADVDAVLVATNWPEFQKWKKLATIPVIDGRPS